MMSSKGIAAIFLCFSYVHFSSAIECTKGTSGSNGTHNSTSSCHGDFCVLAVVEAEGKSAILDRGCINGYLNVEPGCIKDHGQNICFCNTSKQCDSPDILSSTKNATNHEIQCNEGVFHNGKLVTNKTCTGQYCIFGTTTRTSDGQSGYATCMNEGWTFRQFKGSYCLTNIVSPGVKDGLLPVLSCTCDKNLCNIPSSFQTNDKSKKVTCEFGYFKTNSTSSNTTSSQNCTGHYCYTQTAVRPGYNFEKGCIHFFDGAKAVANKSEISFFGRVFQTYYCNKDFCNKEHNKFFNDKHKE